MCKTHVYPGGYPHYCQPKPGEYTGNMGGAVEFWGVETKFSTGGANTCFHLWHTKGNKQGGGAMKEIWTKGLKIPRFPQLDGDTSTEILVIGGGMAGVLCARELQSRGVECLLVEGRTVGSGITSGTTAVLSTLHDPLCQDLGGPVWPGGCPTVCSGQLGGFGEIQNPGPAVCLQLGGAAPLPLCHDPGPGRAPEGGGGVAGQPGICRSVPQGDAPAFSCGRGAVSAGYGPISSAAIFIWSGLPG